MSEHDQYRLQNLAAQGELNNAQYVYDTAIPSFEDNTLGYAKAIPSGLYKNITDTATIKATAGALVGFYVNATNAGTLVLKDGGSGGTAISGTITPAVGWHYYPARFATDLHATKGGTSIDVTFIYV